MFLDFLTDILDEQDLIIPILACVAEDEERDFEEMTDEEIEEYL